MDEYKVGQRVAVDGERGTVTQVGGGGVIVTVVLDSGGVRQVASSRVSC